MHSCISGVGGNIAHLLQRLTDRLSAEQREMALKCLMGINRAIKEKRAPARAWYRAVRYQGQILCYICGTGQYISTVLSGDMAPRGQKW